MKNICVGAKIKRIGSNPEVCEIIGLDDIWVVIKSCKTGIRRKYKKTSINSNWCKI